MTAQEIIDIIGTATGAICIIALCGTMVYGAIKVCIELFKS